MSDKFNEYMKKYEQTQNEYDKLAREQNETMHAMDNAQNADEKKRLQKKMESIADKLRDADKKEKEAKRQLDNYMKTRC